MGKSSKPANSCRRIVAIVGIWLALGSAAWTQCVITGGTNYGSIVQNCNFAPPPLTILSKDFERIKMPDGTFRQQIFVQVGQPITLLLVACGDGVTDLGAAPWPAWMASASDKMTRENCVAHRFFNTAPGRWAMWVDLKVKDAKFTLQPVIEP
jgi:hypothetical protein